MRDKIIAEIAKIKNKYLDSANEIVGDYNRECRITRDYEGRQLYELLQNADDEAANSEGNVKLTFDGRTMTISNTGDAFSFRGVSSLMHSDSSPKQIHANKIGCKGLGFRSVLSWASRITVATADFTIQFSKENAIEFYKSVIKEKPELLNDIRDLTVEEYPIAVLSCPKIIDTTMVEPGFATSIIIECHPNLAETIKGKIKQLEFEELVFLPNTKKVEIICGPDYHKEFYKVDGDHEVLIETRDVPSGTTEVAHWMIYQTSGWVTDDDNKAQGYEFIIAFDPTGMHTGEVLYSYFKTDVKLKFPALIHGTFELASNRNTLIKGGINSKLIPLLADFMVQTAVRISESRRECNYQPLQLVISSDMDNVLSGFYKLDALLREKAKAQPILPTVSGRYISINDHPFYSTEDFASVLKSADFPTLLQVCDDKDVDQYIRNALGVDFCPYETFCQKVNANITAYSRSEKVKLISMILREYAYTYGVNNFPHLLEDTDGNVIDTPVKVYPAPLEEQVISVPKWVNISFLSPEMEKELNGALHISDRREMTRKLARFNLEEYNFDKVLTGVIGQINNQIDTKEKCTDILSWLWGYYDRQERKALPDIKVKVITRDGSIRFAKECYLGREFGNQLGERIVGLYSDVFLSYDEIHGICTDPETLINFAEWLGVSRFPRFGRKTLTNDEKKEYVEACYPLFVANENRFYSKSEFYPHLLSTVTVGCYEHFEEIIDRASINDVLAWLIIDSEAKNRFCAKNEAANSDAVMRGTPQGMRNDRTVATTSMKGYIKWVLQKKKWIPDAQGNKQTPEYCCFEDNGLAPSVIVPAIDYSAIKEAVGRTCKRDVDAILGLFGIEETFQEMSPSVIYRVLFELPTLDPEYKKGKNLYRKLIKDITDPDSLTKNNPDYTNFISNGQVLVRESGVRKYVPVAKAYYANNKIFSKEILNNFCMAEIDSRRGEEKVKKLFGIKPLKELDTSIAGTPVVHRLNEQFCKEYFSFLPFVFACRMDQKDSRDDFRRLKSAKVVLCESVKIKYTFESGERICELSPYEPIFLQKIHTAYIMVPADVTDFYELKRRLVFADAVSEIITTVLSVNDGKEFYRDLFRDNLEDRQTKMRTDQGDDNLSRLLEAREKFKVEMNPRDEFWLTIAGIVNCQAGEEDIAQSVIAGLQLPPDIDASVNFDNINAPENSGALIHIFQLLDIDVNEFNAVSSSFIDLRGYWKAAVKRKAAEYKQRYLANLLDDLSDDKENAEEYDGFCEDYDFAEYDGIINSVKVDINAVFFEQFGVSFSDLDAYEDDAVQRALEEKSAAIAPERLEAMRQRFAKSKVDAFILFDRFDELDSTTEEETPQIPEKTPAESAKTPRSIAQEVLNREAIGMSEISTGIAIRNNDAGNGRKTVSQGKRTHSEATDRAKKEDGLIGEAAVYKELHETYPSTRWISGNAQEAGIDEQGDDSCGYDIKYTDADNNVQYVEVKASKSDSIVFSISDNELRFACDHASNYEVIYVVIGDDGEPLKIWRLGHLFEMSEEEDLFHNQRFTIESEKYVVTAEKVSE